MKALTSVFCVIVLSGCATTGQVVPKANGQYSAIAKGATKSAARDVALKTAADTCNKQNKRHIVGDDVTTYKGVVSEETNRQVDAARNIAAYSGIIVPGLSSGDDYEIALSFTCE